MSGGLCSEDFMGGTMTPWVHYDVYYVSENPDVNFGYLSIIEIPDCSVEEQTYKEIPDAL